MMTLKSVEIVFRRLQLRNLFYFTDKNFCLSPDVSSPPIRSLSSMTTNDFIFRQLFDTTSSTYTYLLADGTSKQAILIDPVVEKVDRDLQLVEELGLQLVYAANTHVHADHVTGTGEIKKIVKNCKSVISVASGAVADIHLQPTDTLPFGKYSLEVRSTPGHTNDDTIVSYLVMEFDGRIPVFVGDKRKSCITYVFHDRKMAFTGDALLIRGCGRTDFQQGSSERLYDSVHTQIFSLPSDFLLYPAHDYKGQTVTSVAEEIKFNPRLSKTKPEFVEIMKNLNLAYPKMIDKAVPANMACGFQG